MRRLFLEQRASLYSGIYNCRVSGMRLTEAVAEAITCNVRMVYTTGTRFPEVWSKGKNAGFLAGAWRRLMRGRSRANPPRFSCFGVTPRRGVAFVVRAVRKEAQGGKTHIECGNGVDTGGVGALSGSKNAKEPQ